MCTIITTTATIAGVTLFNVYSINSMLTDCVRPYSQYYACVFSFNHTATLLGSNSHYPHLRCILILKLKYI